MSEPTERDLARFAEEIARYDKPVAPAAFRASLRRSLLAAPVAAPRRALFGWPGLLALRPILASFVILALIAAAGGSAAASSLPGDPAFALKRGAEGVELALARDDASRLETLVTQSDRRLGDLDTATAQRPSAVAPATTEYLAAVGRVDAALASLLAQPATAARDVITRVSAASATHLAQLQALAARLPDAAQPGIARAIEAQQAVHGRSGSAPGRNSPPGAAPGRPSGLPGGPPPGRGGPPSGVPATR